MKCLMCAALLAAVGFSARAQQALRYTAWADGIGHAQLAKSSLYFLGAGLRAEASRPLRNPTRAVFAQLGYTHWFRKSTSAFTADAALLNLGYRYQSRRAFEASVGVGAQYWREQLRIRFADGTVAETLTNVLPSATVAIGVRINTHYHLELENRLLLKPEAGTVQLRDNVVLALGYGF